MRRARPPTSPRRSKSASGHQAAPLHQTGRADARPRIKGEARSDLCGAAACGREAVATIRPAMPAPASPDRIKDVNERYHDVAAAEYDSKWGIDFGDIGQRQVTGKLRKALGR